MKHFSAIILIFSIIQIQAQITIDDGDMPVGGYRAYISVGDTLFQPDLTNSGANITWDYSGMNAVTQRRDTFVNSSAVPFAIRFFFLNANVVRLQETPDSLGGIALSEAYQFFRRSSSRYENLGLGGTISGIPIGLNNDPRDVVYRFPLNFGNVDSSESLAQLDIPNIFYIERSVKRKNEVDSWGQLTTPYGTFNTLRVKTTIEESDSIAADTIQFRINIPKRREYKWLAKEERVPVLTVNTLVVGNTEVSSGILYVDSLRNTGGTTSVNQALEDFAKLYPNPAQERIFLSIQDRVGEDAEMEILSIEGKLMKVYSLRQGLMEFSVTDLPKGMYIVRVKGSKAMYSGRLILK